MVSGFSTAQSVVLLSLQSLGMLFWKYQNASSHRIGGPISLVKAHWLIFTISLWILTPVMLSFHSEHAAPLFKIVFGLLALSMSFRAVIEIILCLVIKKWKVFYGLAHNFVHGFLLIICLIAQIMSRDSVLETFMLIVLGLSLSSIITEILFVFWFKRNTDGPEKGIYFVPNDERFKHINQRTLYLFLPQYVLFGTLLTSGLFD